MKGNDSRLLNSYDGFTLLELIVVLTILALIAGSVAAGIRLAAATIERGEEATRESARLRASVGIIEQAIRSADLLPVPIGDNTTCFFSGEGKRLRFITSQPPTALCGSGPRMISLHEIPGPEGGLALSVASPFRAEGVGAWEGTDEPKILVPGAVGLAFSYSKGSGEDGKWEWLSEWNPDEKIPLPVAVRVEFSVPSESGPRKTAFVVPIPIGGGIGG